MQKIRLGKREREGLNKKGSAKGNRGITDGLGDTTTLVFNAFAFLPLSLERPYLTRYNSFK